MSKTHTKSHSRELPLNAIRVFTEAARHLNFSRAATALGMSPGGVSRHISSLEAHLGLPLFLRQGPSISLTDAGRQYFDTIKDAVSTIEWATREWTQTAHAGVRLMVRTSLPSFVHTVLIPALPDFQAVSPATVALITSLSAPGAHEPFDVLISRDLSLPHADQWDLLQETLVCVCAPELRAMCGQQPMRDWPFLVTQSRPDVLPDWSRQTGLPVTKLRIQGRFEHYFLAIAAAIGGMGCLVVPRILVDAHLKQGVLVPSTEKVVAGSATYRAFVHPRSEQALHGRLFCRWLKGHLASSTAAHPAARHRPGPSQLP